MGHAFLPQVPAPARDIPRVTLERLRLPIHVTEARCLCGAPLDGRLKSRAVPTERTLARVCREAGAVVRSNGT